MLVSVLMCRGIIRGAFPARLHFRARGSQPGKFLRCLSCAKTTPEPRPLFRRSTGLLFTCRPTASQLGMVLEQVREIHTEWNVCSSVVIGRDSEAGTLGACCRNRPTPKSQEPSTKSQIRSIQRTQYLDFYRALTRLYFSRLDGPCNGVSSLDLIGNWFLGFGNWACCDLGTTVEAYARSNPRVMRSQEGDGLLMLGLGKVRTSNFHLPTSNFELPLFWFEQQAL